MTKSDRLALQYLLEAFECMLDTLDLDVSEARQKLIQAEDCLLDAEYEEY